jgi:hypothetical protein
VRDDYAGPADASIVPSAEPQRRELVTSQGSARGRFQRAIHARHIQNAGMAAREMGGLALADALPLCELLAKADPARYERATLRCFATATATSASRR